MYDISTRQLAFDLGAYPILAVAYDVWEQWRGDRVASLWSDIDLMALTPKVIPLTTVFDVVDGGQDYKFRFMGTASVTLYDEDCTNRSLSNLGWTKEIIGNTRLQLDRVLETCAPCLFSSSYTKHTGMMAEKVNLRLPVIDEQGSVEKIMSIYEIIDHGMNPNEKLGLFKRDADRQD